ncbi:MAG: transcription termination/antitermination factor NusG [Oscillospiraceae bacterium]|nr:transcription termination/antitermination factor NusG [Oscillospiraceae bacterium]
MIENNTEDNINKDADEKPRWYVVHTYSGYENKVATDIEKVVDNRKLDNLIKEVRVPVEKVVEVKDNKKKEVERKMYPGYVLLKMILTDDSWYVVRNTRGVTGFVGPGSKPVPLTDEEVAALGIDVEKVVVDVDFNKGDQVNIKSGTLSGYVGEISTVDTETGIAVVFVFMFGRKMNVEVEISQLEKIK